MLTVNREDFLNYIRLKHIEDLTYNDAEIMMNNQLYKQDLNLEQLQFLLVMITNRAIFDKAIIKANNDRAKNKKVVKTVINGLEIDIWYRKPDGSMEDVVYEDDNDKKALYTKQQIMGVYPYIAKNVAKDLVRNSHEWFGEGRNNIVRLANAYWREIERLQWAFSYSGEEPYDFYQELIKEFDLECGKQNKDNLKGSLESVLVSFNNLKTGGFGKNGSRG